MDQLDHAGRGWRTFPGHPGFARAARENVRGAVGGHHPDVDAWVAAQLTDELFANALRHTTSGRPGGVVVVSYTLYDGGARVAVRDQGDPTPPQPGTGASRPRLRAGMEDEEGGRGLLLVDALAADWGVAAAHGGHTVWFDLGRPASPRDVEPLSDSPAALGSGHHPRDLARLLLTPH